MDWILFMTLFWSALEAALCFNVDPAAWRSLSHPAAGFGYQVVQRQSDLLISAPLQQYGNDGRGQIFRCTTEKCQNLLIPGLNTPVNMSLGLAMTSDPTAQKTLVCGPTIPNDCRSITMYNGLCFEIHQSNAFGKSYPSSTEECQTQADIAFLLDGSGSVGAADFIKMKTFVKDLIGSFWGKDTQFAIAQFSTDPATHYNFNELRASNWRQQINEISQSRGWTYTAKAITHVVNNVFSPSRGSRPNVKKILIVITDGQSQDGNNLQSATRLADSKNIVRFAIGVGSAFSTPAAERELNTIASSPSSNFVFQVGSFQALDQIRQNLQDKIFSIEGSKASGETLKLEMSQGGFRAAYIPEGIQMSMVGANQWRGGYRKYSLQNAELTGSFEPQFIEPDSYLGYSMAVAKTLYGGTLTILGAPRYKHRGVVLTASIETFIRQIDPYKPQTGEYFGAEVCAMDVNSDSYTDLVLISAPMYTDKDRQGQVYVCKISRLNVDCHFDSPSKLIVLRGDSTPKGRFGSSLAVLPDLNKDGFNDLVVGAPLENDGQGSIYIFNGEGGFTIRPTYSQRIIAPEVKSGLKFFGWSISPWSYDQSGDTLPDLAVGSKGTVVLLRSRPLVMVDASVSFSLNKIPTQNPDCYKPLETTATICFAMSGVSEVDTAEAKIGYTLTLDATRKTPNNRAYISKKKRDQTGSVTVDLNKQKCTSVNFFIESCPEDALNPLQNELKFTFSGSLSNTGLRPSLAQQAQTTTVHPIEFEISCGDDNECIDDLRVNFNFTRSSEVKVGIDDLLDVTVSVDNRGENSYNSRIILTYPVGLSYRQFASQRGRIECNSLDSEDGVTRGKTDCSINKPIFKSNSKAVFIVSYGFNPTRQLDRRIFVTANVTSNQKHLTSSELYKKREIDVKYSIFITIESSLSYTNFTFGKNNLKTPFKQLIKVTNSIRALNLTVVVKVPIRLGDKDIWVDMDSLQILDCKKDRDEGPSVKDFVAQIKENKVVDCSVARCRVFRCNRFMERNDETTYAISANLSSGWIEQIGLPSAKFLLTSIASLEYDTNQFIFFSPTSNNTPPVRMIEAEVEVFPEPDFTKEIVGGSLGGLAVIALLTACLYKAGFFKSKYKELMAENADADQGTGEGEPIDG